MNRWVLVTGGAQRLGREICLAFARAGWNVACHYHRSATEAKSLCAEVKSFGTRSTIERGPLNCADDARNIFESTLRSIDGTLQCVVNNASVFQPDTAVDFSERSLLSQLQANLIVPLAFGCLLRTYRDLSKVPSPAALIHILDQKVFNLNPDYFSYTLSKLALERAVLQQAQALAPSVRVNGIAPGLLYPSGPQSDENFALARHANLLRCPIDPPKVADAVLFLAENPCITGVSLCVDNGQHLVPVPRDIMFVVDELLKRVSDEER